MACVFLYESVWQNLFNKPSSQDGHGGQNIWDENWSYNLICCN